ncbi:DUF397 domain-containing protein [Streptomyces sp. NPDC047014]|uniref:DUF397 domain-containing protein n=1 Tax=Streptomyces sp. NPDC047014 TaxID=3155736 RepID=UPI0033E4A608
MTERPQWFTSSYSSNGGNCVEVALAGLAGAVPVRDSKNPGGPVLRFAPEAFAGFIARVKEDPLGAV